MHPSHGGHPEKTGFMEDGDARSFLLIRFSSSSDWKSNPLTFDLPDLSKYSVSDGLDTPFGQVLVLLDMSLCGRVVGSSLSSGPAGLNEDRQRPQLSL